MPGEPYFKTGAELSEYLGVAAEMLGLGIDEEGIGRPLGMKLVPFATAENRTNTSPCIGRKPGASDRIPQRKCSKHSANGVIVIDSLFNKCRDCLVLEDIETGFAAVQSESFNADSSIATEEVFHVTAATPCVIAANVTIVGAEHGSPFTGALYDVHQRR